MSNRYFALTLLALTLSSQSACDCEIGKGGKLVCPVDELTKSFHQISCANDFSNEYTCNVSAVAAADMKKNKVSNFKIWAHVDYLSVSGVDFSYACNYLEDGDGFGYSIDNSGQVLSAYPQGSVKLSGMPNGTPQSIKMDIKWMKTSGERITFIYPIWCVLLSVTLYSADTSMPLVRFVP